MFYYIHGYQSSPESTKGLLFSKTLQAHAVQYRDGKPEDLDIPRALHRISTIVNKDEQCMLIGSSLGGFLAAKTAQTHPQVTHLFLLNPAILPPGTNIELITDVPQSIIQHMYDESLFHQPISAQTVIFLGTLDTVVPNNWGIAFAKAHQSILRFLHDDHQFSNYVKQLPSLISSFL